MLITDADTALIGAALRTAYPAISHITDTGRALEIAAVRYTIAQSSSISATNPYRLLLCKLKEEFPAHANVYAVTRNISKAMSDPRIARLSVKYRNGIVINGYGVWNNHIHEQALYGLQYTALTGAPISIIDTAALRSLLSAYDRQELAALKLQEAIAADTHSSSAKAILADSADALIGSAEQRKRMASDGRGRCYTCTAPKPRGKTCEICGYVPRSSNEGW